jgi:hypothetical protein
MPRSGGGLDPLGVVAYRKKENPSVTQIQMSNVGMKIEILIRCYVKVNGHIQIRGNASAFFFLRNRLMP